ncbi:MAG: pyridoxal-phosphate dependent enzyme [Alphaproteobacteria bacterium]|nr:pyridoxal-phosphate dependent enzyme [Alphaproteobacteria bacterium SS10]
MNDMSSTSGVNAPAPVTSVLEMIGNTPMLKVSNLDTGPCELFLKLDSQNPGGSIKDRIGLSMIADAEASGALKPGGTLVEATAGNTGLGLALVALQRGYKMIIVVPDKMAREKIFHLKAMGADVRLTRSDVGKGHPEYYQDIAARIAEETGAFYVNQFGNDANPQAHEDTTGPEIFQQMDGDIDAMICGVGSGGTLTGLGRYFKRVSPKTQMIVADPVGSIVAHYVKTGELLTEVGSWTVEGIGEDFIPPVCDMSLADDAYTIHDSEAMAVARELLEKEGILAGSSSGTLIAAALRYCREQTEPKRVCTFVCDSGNKYLTKVFNDLWLYDQGFKQREVANDLRDLIAYRHDQGSAVTIGPKDTLLMAMGRMKMYDVSQLPVMDETGTLTGILDESDLLLHVERDEKRFSDPVAAAMTGKLETVPVRSPITDLLPIFDADKVAIVMDGDQFLGLITRIDLLNHLRRKVNA